MKLLRWIGIVLGGLLVVIAATAFGARFADGPIAIFPGGAFASGEWVEEPDVDFGFAADVQEIELQSGSPPSSRTVCILVDGRQAYVPCSLGFPPGKRWHTEALLHPDAVVRIEGRRYRRKLVKVEDEALAARLSEIARGKYGGGPRGDAGVWFFHLAPPG